MYIYIVYIILWFQTNLASDLGPHPVALRNSRLSPIFFGQAAADGARHAMQRHGRRQKRQAQGRERLHGSTVVCGRGLQWITVGLWWVYMGLYVYMYIDISIYIYISIYIHIYIYILF